jgi:hypothetical protein
MSLCPRVYPMQASFLPFVPHRAESQNAGNVFCEGIIHERGISRGKVQITLFKKVFVIPPFDNNL